MSTRSYLKTLVAFSVLILGLSLLFADWWICLPEDITAEAFLARINKISPNTLWQPEALETLRGNIQSILPPPISRPPRRPISRSSSATPAPKSS